LLHPHAKVLVLIPVGFIMQTVQLKAVRVLGFWFILQLLSSAMTASGGGGVAFGNHIGGFIAGMMLIPILGFAHQRFDRTAASWCRACLCGHQQKRGLERSTTGAVK